MVPFWYRTPIMSNVYPPSGYWKFLPIHAVVYGIKSLQQQLTAFILFFWQGWTAEFLLIDRNESCTVRKKLNPAHYFTDEEK